MATFTVINVTMNIIDLSLPPAPLLTIDAVHVQAPDNSINLFIWEISEFFTAIHWAKFTDSRDLFSSFLTRGSEYIATAGAKARATREVANLAYQCI